MKTRRTALLGGAALALVTAMPLARAAGHDANAVLNEGRYGSPPKTWATLLAALRAADRQAALACLAGQAAVQWQVTFAQLRDEDLRTMGGAMRELQMQFATADIAEGLAVGNDNHAGSIGFERTRGGWKITSM